MPKAQSATEFLSQYGSALLIVVVAVAAVYLISFSHPASSYGPSYCYITQALNCYQMLVATNSIGTTVAISFTNDMGQSIYLPPNNALHVSPSPAAPYTSGSCSTVNTGNVLRTGSSTTCSVSIPGFTLQTGQELQPRFYLSYKMCSTPSCADEESQGTLDTSGTAYAYASQYTTSTSTTSTTSTSTTSSSTTSIPATILPYGPYFVLITNGYNVIEINAENHQITGVIPVTPPNGGGPCGGISFSPSGKSATVTCGSGVTPNSGTTGISGGTSINTGGTVTISGGTTTVTGGTTTVTGGTVSIVSGSTTTSGGTTTVTNGKVTVTGGSLTITGSGGGTITNTGGTVTISGGTTTISGTTVTNTGGTVTISGGTTTVTDGGPGGTTLTSTGGTVTISGGTTTNTGSSTGGTITNTGGTTTNTGGSTTISGGGTSVSGGTTTISGGTTTGGTATGSGSGGTIGISITTNTVVSSSYYTTGLGGMAVSPTGKFEYVISNGAAYPKGTILVLDPSTNELIGTVTLPSPDGMPVGIAFSPDGSTAYITTSNGDVVIVSTSSGTVTGTISGLSDPQGIAVSPSGAFAYVVEGTGKIAILNLLTDSIDGTITGPFNNPTVVAFSPNGAGGVMAAVLNTGNVLLINPSNEIIGSLSSTSLSNPTGMAFSQGGDTILVTNSNGAVIVFNINTGAASSPISLPSQYGTPTGIVQYGTVYYISTSDGYIITFNSATGAFSNPVSFGTDMKGIAISPDGSYAFIADGTAIPGGVVLIIDMSTGAITGIITGFGNPNAVAFSPDGRYAYVTTAQGDVMIVSTQTDTIIKTLTGFEDPVGVAFSPDGSYAYVIDRGTNSIDIIDTSSFSIVGTIPNIQNPVGIAVSPVLPDGSVQIWVTTSDNTVIIIDAASHAILATLSNAAFVKLGGLAFSPALTVTIIPLYTQTLYQGQGITFTATPHAGVSPYSYQWYSGQSATCQSDSPISGAPNSDTYTTTPGATAYYCVKVTDSAGSTAYASTTEVVVTQPTPIQLVPTPSNTLGYLYYISGMIGSPRNGGGCSGVNIGNLYSVCNYGGGAEGVYAGYAVVNPNGALQTYANSSIDGGSTPWHGTSIYPGQTVSNLGLNWGYYYDSWLPDNIGCAVVNSYAICVGGYVQGGAGAVDSVYYAALTADGIGTWTSTTPYPVSGAVASCVSSNVSGSAYIYCVGTYNNGGGTNAAVYYAPININSAGQVTGVGTWKATTPYPNAGGAASCVSALQNIYCVGGNNERYASGWHTGTATGTGYFAALSSSGVGQWTQTNGQGSVLSYGNDAGRNWQVQCSTVGTTPPYITTNPYILCTGWYLYSYAPLYSNGIGTWTNLNPWVNCAQGCDSFMNTACAPLVGANGAGDTYCINGDYVDSGGGGSALDAEMFSPISVTDSSVSTLGGWNFIAAGQGRFPLAGEGGTLLAVAHPIGSQLLVSVSVSPPGYNEYPYVGACVYGPCAIPMHGTIVFNSSILGGVPPYSYQWYEEAPGQSGFVPIKGANSPTYAFTAPSTGIGVYNITLVVTDAGSSQFPKQTALSGKDFGVISNSSEGDIATLDTSTGTVVSNLIQSSSSLSVFAPSGVAFSPDGKYAYVAEGDQLGLLNTATNAFVQKDNAKYEPYAFAPISNTGLAYALNKSIILILNTTNGTVLGNITKGISAESIAVSPDGSYAYVTNLGPHGYGNVSVINVASNTVVNVITAGIRDPYKIAFSPDGKYVYVGNEVGSGGFGSGGNVVIIDTATNTVIGAITSGISTPEGIAVSPDGSYLYVGNMTESDTGTITIFSTSTNLVVGAIQLGYNIPYSMAFTPSGKYLFVLDQGYQPFIMINATTNKFARASSFPANLSSVAGSSFSPSGIAFSKNGAYLYIAETGLSSGTPGAVAVFKTSTNTIVSCLLCAPLNSVYTPPGLGGMYPPTSVAISPDGSYGYAISSKLHAAIANVIIFNTSTGVVSGSVPGTGHSVYVAFSPDGKYAYDAINCENGGCTNGEIEIISTATNTVVGSITSGIYNPWGIAFSPSSPYAYVANDNFPTGNITIINTHTGTVTGTITSGIGVPRGISFSPNGKYAYVVNDNYSFSNPLDLSANVVIIDTSTDRVVGSVTSGIINPMDVAVAPSGAFAYIADCYIVNGNYC